MSPAQRTGEQPNDFITDAIGQIHASDAPDEIVYLDLTRGLASRLQSIELFGQVLSDFTRLYNQ